MTVITEDVICRLARILKLQCYQHERSEVCPFSPTIDFHPRYHFVVGEKVRMRGQSAYVQTFADQLRIINRSITLPAASALPLIEFCN